MWMAYDCIQKNDDIYVDKWGSHMLPVVYIVFDTHIIQYNTI
jgi:hypothetical protein